MRKKYLKLTKDQRSRGVQFSSQFFSLGMSGSRGVMHEITAQEYKDNPKEAEAKEARLRDIKFFKGWGQDSNGKAYNEIRA